MVPTPIAFDSSMVWASPQTKMKEKGQPDRNAKILTFPWYPPDRLHLRPEPIAGSNSRRAKAFAKKGISPKKLLMMPPPSNK